MSKKITTRINDEEIERALERGVKSEGSQSDAVREALKRCYMDGPDSGDETLANAIDALQQVANPGGYVEVGTAESAVANRLNIPKSSVRNTIFARLRNRDKIRVLQQINSVSIQLSEELR